MTRFGRSTVGSELFVTHDAAREEAFIDAFASLRATATLDAHDEHLDTYLAIQDELLRAETERRMRGEPAPLTKTFPRPRVAARVILALGLDRDDVERHCARLAFDYGLVHLSASELTRAHVARETRGVAVFERWDAVLSRSEWAFSTDLTLRLLREAIEKHGNEKKFIIDWFPANLDQAREFETRVAPVDFAIFFDVEALEDVGVIGGPDDPLDEDRKKYEAFAAKHAVVLNQYKSNGMVHHVRSPPDKAHVTLVQTRAQVVGPMRREFYRGERISRDTWTAKDRPDWTWHDDTQGLVRPAHRLRARGDVRGVPGRDARRENSAGGPGGAAGGEPGCAKRRGGRGGAGRRRARRRGRARGARAAAGRQRRAAEERAGGDHREEGGQAHRGGVRVRRRFARRTRNDSRGFVDEFRK
jgi:adenylate kinase family enzyme